MRKIWLAVAIVVLGSIAHGQGGTTSSDIYPANSGQNLGYSSKRWNLYGLNLDFTGTFTYNSIAYDFTKFARIDTTNTYAALNTFSAGITGTGNTGTLTAGSGITGTANAWSALQTFNSGIVGRSLAGVRYANQFTGSDVGAQAAAAIADYKTNGIVCEIVLSPGIISTAFDPPAGCHVTFQPGVYTVSTQIVSRHRGQTWDMDGAQLQCAMDSGTPCFYVGNSSTGTVNTSGTAVTWASGSNFSTLDSCATMNIAGVSYNIATVTDSTHLTLTSSAGTQTGASYGIYLDGSTACGTSPQPTTIRGLWLVKTGTTTTAVNGMNMVGVGHLVIDKATIQGFTNSGAFAMNLLGVISAKFNAVKMTNNSACRQFDRVTLGGVAFDSNNNVFTENACLAATAGGVGFPSSYANAILNGSNNTFVGDDNEGDVNAYVWYMGLGANACNNSWIQLWDERNGNTASGAEWYNNSGCSNIILSSTLQSNTAMPAVTVNGSGSVMDVRDTVVAGSFSYGYYIGGGSAIIDNFKSGAIANATNGFPYILRDASGNVTASGTVTLGQLNFNHLLVSPTAPTISSGFGTSASVTANNATAAFEINVGTGGTASSGVVGLPTASNGWNCTCNDITTQSTSDFLCKQTASSTTSATLTEYNTAGAATAWTASDKLRVSCFAY